MPQSKDRHRIHSRHETSNEDILGFTWGKGFNIQWQPNKASEEGASLTAILKALKDRLEYETQELRPAGYPKPPNQKPAETELTEALKHVEAAIKALNVPA